MFKSKFKFNFFDQNDKVIKVKEIELKSAQVKIINELS